MSDSKPISEPILEPIIDSKQQPAWHVVVLSIFSLCTYIPIWFYIAGSRIEKEALRFKDESESKSSSSLDQAEKNALARLERAGTRQAFASMTDLHLIISTFLMCLPVVNLFVLMRYAAKYATLIPDTQDAYYSWARNNPTFAAFVIACAFGALVLLNKLPGNWFLLFTLASLPLAVVQSWLNKHWKNYENEEYLARQAFSPLEILIIIIGASLLGMIAINPEINGRTQ